MKDWLNDWMNEGLNEWRIGRMKDSLTGKYRKDDSKWMIRLPGSTERMIEWMNDSLTGKYRNDDWINEWFTYREVQKGWLNEWMIHLPGSTERMIRTEVFLICWVTHDTLHTYFSTPYTCSHTAQLTLDNRQWACHSRCTALSIQNQLIYNRRVRPQVRELLVWLPLKPGTTYLTLYDLATLLHHLKITWKLIRSIRHLPPDSPPIHCDPSLNACLDSRACIDDVNLT